MKIVLVGIIVSLMTNFYISMQANKMTDDAVEQIDAITATMINSQVEMYVGSHVRGSTLQGIEERFVDFSIEIECDGDIKKDEYYDVEALYDEKGIAYKIIITKE